MSEREPSKPTRRQTAAEKRLRDMGVTVTFAAHSGHDARHPSPVPGCMTCAFAESARRVNGADHE